MRGMPKRTLGALSGGGEDISPTAKRSKLGDQPATMSSNRQNCTEHPAAGRKKQALDEEPEPLGSDDEGDTAANCNSSLDERIGEMVRQKMEAQKGKVGLIAEHGVIETLYVENFMCHTRFSFKFGPQMNFIVGHNGSGKSAALSALRIALGGKMGSSRCGNNLKDFIKEGQNSSLVRVGIKNRGTDAYLPETYGPRLFVERRFTRDGRSMYKIFSGSDEDEFQPVRVLSTRTADLNAICDHMNIQVDNPLSILTQDGARQFLSASSARDKYKFFLEGTQLLALADQYTVLEERIAVLKRQADVRKEGLKDLKDKLLRSIARWEMAKKTHEVQDQMECLNGELAWAHVAGKRDEVEEAVKPVRKAKTRLEKLNSTLLQAQIEVDHATATLEAATQKLPTMSEEEEKEQGALAKRIKAITRGEQEVDAEMKACNKEMKLVTEQLAELDCQIAAENGKLEAQTQKVTASFHARIAATKGLVCSLEASMASRLVAVTHSHLTRDAAKSAVQNAEAERVRLKDAYEGLVEGIDNAQDRSALVVYGPATEDIRCAIDNERENGMWVGQTPVGPVGTLVELASEEVGRIYGGVLRNVLGGQLFGYVVSDVRDLEPLKVILARFKASNPVTVAPMDMFDYSSGEPPKEVLTILRALKIKDEWITRVLINAMAIEKTALAPTREDAQTLAERYDLRMVYTADERLIRTFGDGGGELTSLQPPKPGESKTLLFKTGQEVEEFITQVRQDKADLIRRIAHEVEMHKREYERATQEMNAAKAQYEEARHQLSSQRATLNSLEAEAEAEVPVSVSGLADLRKQAEGKKDNLKAQFETMLARMAQLKEELQPSVARDKELRMMRERVESEASAIITTMNTAAEDMMQKQKNVAHWQTCKVAAEREIDEGEQRVNVLNKELIKWTEGAREIQAKEVSNPRPVKTIQVKLQSLKQAVANYEAEQGATLDEMSREVTKAREEYDEEKRRGASLRQLIKMLNTALEMRQAKWKQFRTQIAIRCKHEFHIHMLERGFFGKVLFDHVNGKLSLRIETVAMAQAQPSGNMGNKDTKSLSGGEKSFSTICLLIALWEAIGCPIRCLDELDVFMDAVNRRVSMKMIMAMAEASDSKQYILISPLALDNITLGETTVVLRMDDPERSSAHE